MWPYGGELTQAQKGEDSDVLVVFVHHYGGNMHTTKRHSRLVNKLGYDSFRFNLPYNPLLTQTLPHKVAMFLSMQLTFGLDRLWGNAIYNVLQHFKDRKIIIYSLSSPSFGAIHALAKCKTPPRVLGWICDGGPFFNLWKSFENYFSIIDRIPNKLLRAGVTTFSYFLWRGPFLKAIVQKKLKSFRKGFPILSLRGNHDLLVPPESIAAVFEGHDHLNLQVLDLKESGHLDGIKLEPKIYRETVKEFLKIHADFSKSQL